MNICSSGEARKLHNILNKDIDITDKEKQEEKTHVATKCTDREIQDKTHNRQ